MSRADVQITLRDESSYIPSGSSVYGGIVGAFKKGPLEPTLCTSQSQFLKWFSPDGKLKVGYPQEYQSALDYLADADALWVVRAVSESTPPLLGGLTINTATAETAYTHLDEGIEVPEAYSFKENESFLILGANPGAWNNEVYITFTPNTSEGLENVYDLKVFKKRTTTGYELLETHVVSKNVEAVDGNGNSIYLETVVNGNSNYIQVADNITETTVQTQAQEIELANGSDGDAVSTADYINGLKKLANPEELSLQLLMDGGVSEITYANAMLQVAGEDRKGECFCILSTPQSAENNTTGGAIQALKSYRDGISSSHTYLGSMYTPHIKSYNRFTDRYNWVSPDGIVAKKINQAIRDYGYNYPAAGYTRGVLDSALDVYTKFLGGELDALDEMQINVIKNDTSRGITIMGNTTLYPTKSDFQDQNNMLTANLQIKPGLREFLKDYLFELNDDITRSIIVSKINLFMRDVKSQNGVSDFYVVCDNTNNSPNDVAQGILHIDLYVKFVKSIKFIKTNIIATAQGLDFSAFTAA